MNRTNENKYWHIEYRASSKGLTLLEMVIALAMMSVIFASIVPQFTAIRNGWDSKRGVAEALQNGRIMINHLNHNLAKAVKITAVSDSSETNGYIQFEDNDGNNLRYEIVSSYVQFGEVGDLSDLAGPVSQLQFTCYDACDLDTALSPITDANLIRFVHVETILANSAALGEDKALKASVYLRAGGGGSGGGGGAAPVFQGFTEAKAASGVTSLVVSTPGGVNLSEGDLLIAAVATDGGTASSLSPPGGEGWTEIDVGDSSSNVTLGLWWKLSEQSESSTHEFGWSGGQEAYGWMMWFTGQDAGSPINAVATASLGNKFSPPSPSVTTTVDNALIVRLGAFDDDDIIVDYPGLWQHTPITMDESGSGGGTVSGGAGYAEQASSGASGTSYFFIGYEQSRTVTVAVAPGGGGQIRP